MRMIHNKNSTDNCVWRIVRAEGSRGHYVITNDVDTYDFVHGSELYKYGLIKPEEGGDNIESKNNF